MTIKICFEDLAPQFRMRESNIRESLGTGLQLAKAELKKCTSCLISRSSPVADRMTVFQGVENNQISVLI